MRREISSPKRHKDSHIRYVDKRMLKPDWCRVECQDATLTEKESGRLLTLSLEVCLTPYTGVTPLDESIEDCIALDEDEAWW